MNIFICTARPTKEPEIRQSNDLTIARFTGAVDRRKEGADFLNFVAFGKTADFVRDYVHKGAKYAVTAHVQTGSYEKDGHKVYTTEFCIDSIEFCEKKQDFEPVPEGLNLPFDKGEA